MPFREVIFQSFCQELMHSKIPNSKLMLRLFSSLPLWRYITKTTIVDLTPEAFAFSTAWAGLFLAFARHTGTIVYFATQALAVLTTRATLCVSSAAFRSEGISDKEEVRCREALIFAVA
jgi:hypothetical protein